MSHFSAEPLLMHSEYLPQFLALMITIYLSIASNNTLATLSVVWQAANKEADNQDSMLA